MNIKAGLAVVNDYRLIVLAKPAVLFTAIVRAEQVSER